MIEKGRISAIQMSFLIYTNIMATGILFAPSISYKYAGRDFWISPLWGALSGFLTVFIVYRLHQLYPGESLIQYIQHIIGKIPGKVIGFFCLILYLHTSSTSLKQYGDFLVGQYLNKTPPLVVIGSLALATALAVHAGLEVLARLANIFVPMFIILWLLIVLLLIPDMEVKNLLPIMENGVTPTLKGAFAPITWNSLLFFISPLLPFLADKKHALKCGMYTVIAMLLTFVITDLAALFLFGGITGNFLYPFMTASRYISYADFFENLESLVMAIWISGMFIKLGSYHYILALNVAQWLNLSEYKHLAFPTALLLTLYGIWSSPNIPVQSYHLGVTIPFLTIIFFIILPTVLLLIALLKNRLMAKSVGNRK